MEHHPSQHQRAHRIELVLESCDDAKVPTPAAHAPEEVGMFGGARRPELAIRRDDVDGEEVIGRQAVLTAEPADPATQGEARNAGIGAGAPGGGQPERLGLAVELAPGGATFGARGPPRVTNPWWQETTPIRIAKTKLLKTPFATSFSCTTSCSPEIKPWKEISMRVLDMHTRTPPSQPTKIAKMTSNGSATAIAVKRGTTR